MRYSTVYEEVWQASCLPYTTQRIREAMKSKNHAAMNKYSSARQVIEDMHVTHPMTIGELIAICYLQWHCLPQNTVAHIPNNQRSFFFSVKLRQMTNRQHHSLF